MATGNWTLGNDNNISVSDFSAFTYVGNAADGTAANYGTAPA
jgi:hypothetical protein